MVEFSSITAAIAIGVGLWNLIRVEQVRRAGTDEALRQKLAEDVAILHKRIEVEGSILREKLEIEHLKTSILEARLKPLLDSFDKRLADMFHQPHESSWRLDRLIEEYKSHADHMPDRRLQELIDEAYAIHRQSGKDGQEPNPFIYFTSGLWLGLIDGRRNARQVARAHESRLRELEQRQVMLEGEQRELEAATSQQVPDTGGHPWWTRWWKSFQEFLGGSR